MAYHMPGWEKVMLVDWTMRLNLRAVPDLSSYLGSHKSASLIKEFSPGDEFSALSLILPEDCSHSNCSDALSNCSDLTADSDTEVKRLVIKSNELRVWAVECAIFNKKEIPESDGGLPGRRLSTGERGMGDTATKTPGSEGLPVKTPAVIENYDTSSTSVALKGDQTEYCQRLKQENVAAFYKECCLNNKASDSHCALTTILNAYEEQNKEVKPAKPNIVENPFPESTAEEDEDDDDISRLAKDLDLDEDFVDLNKTEEEQKTEEEYKTEESQLLDNISSWKSKYFTVLGFFLVFLAIFLVVIVALIYKIRKSKAVTVPGSPGPGLSVSRHERSRRGYSSVAEEAEDKDREPLPPATQQAQAFNY